MKIQVHGLERHRFAPELNCLHLTDGREVRTPGCTTIEQAMEHPNYLRFIAEQMKTTLVKHNKSLAEQLSKNDKPLKFNLSKNKR